MNTVTQINNSKDKQTHFILNGNLWNIMVQLSWPAIIAMVLYGLNAVIAAVFVGRFVGEEALAGVSVAYPLTQISLGLGSLIGVGLRFCFKFSPRQAGQRNAETFDGEC